MSDNTAIVLDFHIELIIRQNSSTEFKNICKSIGTKPVFCIIADMCLQQHLFFLTSGTAAVDKPFYHVADFGQMGMARDKIAIGKNKPGESPRMFTQGFSQGI